MRAIDGVGTIRSVVVDWWKRTRRSGGGDEGEGRSSHRGGVAGGSAGESLISGGNVLSAAMVAIKISIMNGGGLRNLSIQLHQPLTYLAGQNHKYLPDPLPMHKQRPHRAY